MCKTFREKWEKCNIIVLVNRFFGSCMGEIIDDLQEMSHWNTHWNFFDLVTLTYKVDLDILPLDLHAKFRVLSRNVSVRHIVYQMYLCISSIRCNHCMYTSDVSGVSDISGVSDDFIRHIRCLRCLRCVRCLGRTRCLRCIMHMWICLIRYVSQMYCKSTKFGVLLNLADLALGQKLNRII